MEDSFRFRQFNLRNRDSALKVGTDAVLLGAAMTISPEDRTALDIGTGTGVIALMAAQRAPQLHIKGIDPDRPSADEAAYNFGESPWGDRLEALNVSLQEYMADAPFDLIFSNPPYYDSSLRNPDERAAAARHCDTLSVSEIFAFAAEHLTEDGRVSLILPAQNITSARRVAASYGLAVFRLLNIRTTAAKSPKRTIMELIRGQSPQRIEEQTLILMEHNSKTTEYKELTKDFYLY